MPIESVSVLLGHTDVRITSKHYRPWVKSLQDKLEADVRQHLVMSKVRLNGF